MIGGRWRNTWLYRSAPRGYGRFGTTWRVEPTTGLIVTTLAQVQWASPQPPALLTEVVAAAHAALAE